MKGEDKEKTSRDVSRDHCSSLTSKQLQILERVQVTCCIVTSSLPRRRQRRQFQRGRQLVVESEEGQDCMGLRLGVVCASCSDGNS